MKIKDLFELNKEFKNFELIAGEQGLENEIRSVEVIEIPEGVYWVNDGDLMITTGYFIKKDEITFENFVGMLIYRKASGLGIKLGRFVEKIPDKIIKMANDNNFPIINIPMHMRYNSILWPVATRLINSDDYDKYIVEKYKSEMKVTLKMNNQIDSFIDLISTYIGFPTAIFDNTNYKQINTSHELEGDLIHSVLEQNISIINASKKDYVLIEKSEGSYYVYKIEAGAQIIAFLCIFAKDDKILSLSDKKIIEESILPIAINLLAYTNTDSSYFRSLDNFYTNLLKGNYSNNDRGLRDDASYFDIEYYKKRFVWILEFPLIDEKDYERLKLLISQVLEIFRAEYYIKDVMKRLTVVTHFKSTRPEDRTIESFFSEVFRALDYSFEDNNFEIGVSKICDSLKGLSFTQEEAAYAFKLGRKVDKKNRIYYYDDYMIYHLLYEISNHPSLSKLYKNTIERIKNYDEKYKSDWFKTITAYIENDFNINETANCLFIHRNTLYKRINKINSILNLNLEKSEHRLILQLAVKLYKIKE